MYFCIAEKVYSKYFWMVCIIWHATPHLNQLCASGKTTPRFRCVAHEQNIFSFFVFIYAQVPHAVWCALGAWMCLRVNGAIVVSNQTQCTHTMCSFISLTPHITLSLSSLPCRMCTAWHTLRRKSIFKSHYCKDFNVSISIAAGNMWQSLQFNYGNQLSVLQCWLKFRMTIQAILMSEW